MSRPRQPDLFGEGGEGQDVGAGALKMLGHGGELLGERVDDPVELGVHRVGVGLVADGVQHRLDPPRELCGVADISSLSAICLHWLVRVELDGKTVGFLK
jgi:hypothetical protein